MPHILLKSHDNIAVDLDKKFKFIAKDNYDEKICVVDKDKEFLLTKVKKDSNDLIKLDIPTRFSPVSIMKEALNDYATASKAEVLFTNTHSIHNNKIKPEEKYLKDINYFVDDFKTNKEIWVEVGFGSGTHLLHQAQQNPDKIIIGLEIHYPSIEQVLKHAKLQNIENILVVNYDARLFLEFLDSNSVGKVFVHFPVPWDKKPHRRVMSIGFIDECLRVLRIDGRLELRTDSPNYFEYSSGLLDHFKEYPNEILKNKDLDITSKYEARWKKQEKDIWDIFITSTQNSSEVKLDGNFDFPNSYDSEIVKSKISKKAIIKDDYLIHFENVYEIDDSNIKGLLIKLTFGSFNKPVTKYIYLENTKMRYFQGDPIKTRINLEAHKTILDILK
ncbi:MAG: tRNA (guanosine(46)-N7)-methyltransferase TrmB [Campylobacterota bacterium]|nr:tRNA (guanosine(46)-N7)-methyltransferase TrmB [Campylobacterota bacterium]